MNGSRCMCVAAMLMLASLTARAQTDRLMPTVLQLPASARALALGDAFVAGRGSEMVFYNPALIGVQPGVSASVQRFGSASTLGALSSALSAGPIGLAIGIQMLDYGAAAAGGTRASIDLGSRGVDLASSLAASLAAASQFKGVRFGVTAKYVEERIGTDRDGQAAFDVGVEEDFGRFSFGLAAQHLGAGLHLGGERRELPTRVTFGTAAFSPPLWTFWDLGMTAAVSYRRDGAWIPAGGVEVTFVPLDGWAFSGRVGARRAVDLPGASRITFGAGFSLDRVSLDYAHEGTLSEAAHRIGLRVR